MGIVKMSANSVLFNDHISAGSRPQGAILTAVVNDGNSRKFLKDTKVIIQSLLRWVIFIKLPSYFIKPDGFSP